MNFEAGKEKISKPSKQSGWWRETFGFYACLWLNLFFGLGSHLFLERFEDGSLLLAHQSSCRCHQIHCGCGCLEETWDEEMLEQWAVDPGYLLFFFGGMKSYPGIQLYNGLFFFQPISGSSDEPISGISQAFWLLLTWALRWTGNPPWIILVWSKITAWETQPFLNRKSAYRHGYFQRYLRICGNLSEYLCVTYIQDLIYIYIYIQYIHVTYLLHMIHILWLTMYYHLYNLHQHIWIAPRRSGSDTDSTTATVGSSSSASGISSSLETSVIQSLKAEGPKYSCVNCSA